MPFQHYNLLPIFFSTNSILVQYTFLARHKDVRNTWFSKAFSQQSCQFWWASSNWRFVLRRVPLPPVGKTWGLSVLWQVVPCDREGQFDWLTEQCDFCDRDWMQGVCDWLGNTGIVLVGDWPWVNRCSCSPHVPTWPSCTVKELSDWSRPLSEEQDGLWFLRDLELIGDVISGKYMLLLVGSAVIRSDTHRKKLSTGRI